VEMNAAIDYPGSALAQHAAHGRSPRQRVAGMYSDAGYIAGVCTLEGSICSRVSSTITGSTETPAGVAAAST